MGVNKPKWLGHIDLFIKDAMQKGICNISLM